MRKKKLLLSVIFCLVLLIPISTLHGVTINIPWSVLYGWESYHAAYPWAEGVIVDGSGNIYTTGSSYLWDQTQFGWPTPPVTLGMYQAPFVAKWNKKGKLIWYTLLASEGGPGGGFGSGIDLDRDGNVYVTGFSWYGWNSLQFDPPLIPHNGNGDGFVAKLDPSGSLLWYTFLGGSDYDNLTAIDVTRGGSIVVTGESSAAWNTGVYGSPLIEFNTPSSYGSDIVVAKLNTSGDLQWYTFLGGDDYQHATSVKVASGGGVFVTGQTLLYWPEIKYGRPLHDKLVDDQYDGFLAKLSPSGAFQWYTFMGEETSVYPMSIDSTQNGKLFLAGTQIEYSHIITDTAGSSTTGRIPENGNSINPNPDKLYVASYSFSGEKIWVKTPFVANYSAGMSIDTGPLGDLFISGSSADGLPGDINSDVKIDSYQAYMPVAFVMCMNQSGKKKWIYKFNRENFSSAQSVAAFNNGITYVTGNNWGGGIIAASLGTVTNGMIFPVIDPQLFLVKINHLYTVEATVKNTGGIVEPELSEVVPGHDAVINFSPDTGYEVDKIVDNGEAMEIVNPYLIPAVNWDHELEIYFRLIKYPPELILTGTRTTDNSWIIEKDFGDLTITIVEHETSPMEVKAFVLYKYKDGEWKELTRFTDPGNYAYEDKYLIKEGEAKYVLKALAPDGSVVVESDILIL